MSSEIYVYKQYYKTVKEVPQKYWPEREKEVGPDGKEIITIMEESPAFFASVLDHANNMRNNEEKEKFEAKREEKEQKRMQEYEEQQRKNSERWRQYYRNLPEQQLQMFLSGERPRCGHCRVRQNAEFFGHAANCPYYHIIGGQDIEPGMQLLKEEFRTGKIIKRVTWQRAYDRLVEFAIPDETWENLMNRLLDIATAASLEATT